jgi:hypothetical protein
MRDRASAWSALGSDYTCGQLSLPSAPGCIQMSLGFRPGEGYPCIGQLEFATRLDEGELRSGRPNCRNERFPGSSQLTHGTS